LLTAGAAIAASYSLGSIPIAYLAGRAKGIDVRDVGSGNAGASNVWQSVSRALVVPVGLGQVVQGGGAVLIARALDQPPGVQMASGLAAIVANNWNPWLRLRGGRGVGAAIGVLAVSSPPALGAFIAVSLAGVALRSIPQGVAAGLASAPVVAAMSGAPRCVSMGLALASGAILLKRVLGNEMPDARYERPRVWLTRLICDRDDADRDAWVRRNLEADVRR
jgi:glycerol-3-phosphate acyltransferase PlsY